MGGYLHGWAWLSKAREERMAFPRAADAARAPATPQKEEEIHGTAAVSFSYPENRLGFQERDC